MRHLLATATVVALLSTTGGAVGAQEASPDPEASPTPEQLAEAEERLATATCLGKPATIVSIDGFETVGTPGADVIVGTEGDDIIRGEGGNDRICSGPGADVVEGGAGKDRIDGGLGDDQLDGGTGNDIINGGKGADMVTGAAGNDRLTGAGGDDTLDGGKGKDVCAGGQGHDRLPGCNEKRRTRGTLVITRNTVLKGPHKGAIAIAKNGVRLDCDGHTISGLGKQDFRLQGGIGIHFQQRRRVTVTDCHVTNFNHGMQNDATRRSVIRYSSANGNFAGFALDGDTRLIENAAIGNDEVGFSVGGKSTELTGNVADGSPVGFLVYADGNVLERNTAAGNETGFQIGSVRNTLRDNTATDNVVGFLDESFGGSGLAGSRNVHEGNMCADNRTPSVPDGLCLPAVESEATVEES